MQKNFEVELDEFLNRETFTQKMIKNKSRKFAEHSFQAELQEHWALYAFLCVSAIFSLMLGVFMGMSPTVNADGSVWFHTDGAHILMSAIYGLAFVTVTEFAFALAKRKYYTRENDNLAQTVTMVVMMIFAGISVFGTGVAGGVIVASTIDFMSAFVTVPAWAQTWVVRVIPGLIVFYTVLLTIYSLSSNKARSERILRARQTDFELDLRNRKATAEQFAQFKIENLAVNMFLEKMASGEVSAAEALALAQSGNLIDSIVAGSGKKVSPAPAEFARPRSDGKPLTTYPAHRPGAGVPVNRPVRPAVNTVPGWSIQDEITTRDGYLAEQAKSHSDDLPPFLQTHQSPNGHKPTAGD